MTEREEIINEWITRLESGTTRQCTGVLRDGEARCALGVLADVLVARGLATWVDDTDDGIAVAGSTDTNDMIPNVLWRDKLRFNTCDISHIWAQNDTEKKPFDAIADVVRRISGIGSGS